MQLYVTFVGSDEDRTVSVTCLSSPVDWDEATVTWRNFGSPSMDNIGWFSIFDRDRDSLVEIALGSLPVVNGKITLVMGMSQWGSGPEKFDFRSVNFGATPPALKASPVLEERDWN